MKKIVFSLLVIVGLIFFSCSLAKDNFGVEGLKTEFKNDSLFLNQKLTTLTQELAKEKLLTQKYAAEKSTLKQTIHELEKELATVNNFIQTTLTRKEESQSLPLPTEKLSQRIYFLKNEISLQEKEMKKFLKKNHALQTENNQLEKEMTLTKELLQKTKTHQEVLIIKIISLFTVVLGALVILLASLVLKK